jgi:hypothetical protein
MTSQELRCLAESLIQDLIRQKGDKIRAALSCDALFERCSEDIQEARGRFSSTIGASLSQRFPWIFDEALNDLLLAHSSHQPCPLW